MWDSEWKVTPCTLCCGTVRMKSHFPLWTVPPRLMILSCSDTGENMSSTESFPLTAIPILFRVTAFIFLVKPANLMILLEQLPKYTKKEKRPLWRRQKGHFSIFSAGTIWDFAEGIFWPCSAEYINKKCSSPQGTAFFHFNVFVCNYAGKAKKAAANAKIA